MKITNICLNTPEINLLKSFIGKTITSISHDPFTFTNSSSQAVQINIGKDIFYLYSFVEPLDYYGSIEDVAVWTLENQKFPIIDKKAFISTPINEKIKKITIVQENQRLYKNKQQIYDVYLTRGIIFEFSEYQLSFEKDIWFSEEIKIQKGYNLISKFAPETEFIDSDWDNGLNAECSRTFIVLN